MKKMKKKKKHERMKRNEKPQKLKNEVKKKPHSFRNCGGYVSHLHVSLDATIEPRSPSPSLDAHFAPSPCVFTRDQHSAAVCPTVPHLYTFHRVRQPPCMGSPRTAACFWARPSLNLAPVPDATNATTSFSHLVVHGDPRRNIFGDGPPKLQGTTECRVAFRRSSIRFRQSKADRGSHQISDPSS